MKQIFNLNNAPDVRRAQEFMANAVMLGKTVELEFHKKTRTASQNRAIHVLFTNLASELNDQGLYMTKVLKRDAEIQWTPEAVKEYLWRPIQEAMLGKKSTRDLTTKEIDQVFEVVNKHLGESLGIETSFPSVEAIINEERIKETRRVSLKLAIE